MMKVIELQEVIIKNYRSFRNETITFSPTIGLKLFSGENRVETRLGSNGSGKSSFWSAIEWCFHGTSVDGSKISDNLTWGETQADVKIKLLVSGQQNIVHRFGPPVKVELNGQLVEQHEIDTLIGLSKLRFLHSVIFGQDINLFPDLAVPERGALLDDVLDSAIWQKATEAAGSKYTELEKVLLKKKSDITYITGKLSALQTDKYVNEEIQRWEEERESELAQIRQRHVDWEAENKQRIAELEKDQEEWKAKLLEQIEIKAVEIENLEASIAPQIFEIENEIVNPLAAQISVIQHQLKYSEELRDKYIEVRHKANYDYNSCLKAEQFWANDKCPVCAQTITQGKKNHELDCAAKIKAELEVTMTEADKQVRSAKNSIETSTKILEEFRETTIQDQEKKKRIRSEVERVKQQIAKIESEAVKLIAEFDRDENPFTKQIVSIRERESPYIKQEQDLEAKINPFISKLDSLQKERKKLSDELMIQENEYKLIEARMVASEFWKHGFKRIRLFFIQQVLAALELEIQSALSALGLENWKVGLVTESETRSQTIKLGVQIQITSPKITAKWEVFCGGEKQRLRLGIALGLGSLIQRASGTIWNLEVLDEPSRSLSPEGIEDLLEALRYRAEVLGKQIFLTDHSSIQTAGFTEIWMAIKDTSGTHIEKQYQEA